MGLNKYQNCDFTSSSVTFYQKSIYDFLNSFPKILIDGIFSGSILHNLEFFFFFFHKITVAEKNFFSSNA